MQMRPQLIAAAVIILAALLGLLANLVHACDYRGEDCDQPYVIIYSGGTRNYVHVEVYDQRRSDDYHNVQRRGVLSPAADQQHWEHVRQYHFNHFDFTRR